MIEKVLVNSLRCTDNKYMHETCRKCIFIKLYAMKMSHVI